MTDNLLRTMAIITDVSAADNISAMWATVITGIIVVFLILAVLIGLLYVISFFSNLGNKKKKEYSDISRYFHQSKHCLLERLASQ